MDKNFSKIKKNRLLPSIRQNRPAKKGFSLIEVLVALLVLSVGIAAIAILMVKNIKDLHTSKNQIIASMLAQEGIELVRNLKDNTAAFVTTPIIGKANGSDYRIDIGMSYANFLNNAASDKKLYLNSGFYTHTNTGTPTKFSRKIEIANGTGQITVTCYASWNASGIQMPCNIGNKCVSTVSIMTD